MRSTLLAQVPVFDRIHNDYSQILREVQEASEEINQRVSLVYEEINNYQSLKLESSTKVNRVITNIELVETIQNQKSEIDDLIAFSMDLLNSPAMVEGDDDNSTSIDVWKYMEVTLGIAARADSVFDLFENILEDDSIIMDDRGRLAILRDTYNETIQIKSTLKTHINRINRAVYQQRKIQQEIKVFDTFFE